MVFYVPPKLLKTGDGPASFSNIADETILQIIQDLPTPDILRIRLACKNVVPACNTTLSKRLTTLYVHPSTGPMRKALEICAHPVFSQEIEEVVLLGKVQWQEIEKAYPGYRRRGTSPVMTVAGDPGFDYSEVLDWQSRFRTWPTVFPGLGNGSEVENAAADSVENDMGFDEAYRALLDALARLPKLEKLAFAERVDKSGFNQVAETALQSHANKCARPPAYTAYLCGAKVRDRPDETKQLCTRRADADVIHGLLLSPRLKFTSLGLGRELPFIENIWRDLCLGPQDFSYWHNNHQFGSLSLLTSLELHQDIGWADNVFSTRLYRRLIVSSKDTLKRLRLVFVPNASIKHVPLEGSLQNMLKHIQLSKLEEFGLELGAAPPGTILSIWPAYSTAVKRHLRPLCQLFDMERFLCDHLDTLTHVVFKNVIFAHLDANAVPYRVQVAEYMRKILDVLCHDSKQLKQCQWTVNRFGHDRRCKRGDNESMLDCTKFNCGQYVDGMGTRRGGEFQELATDINVLPDEDTNTWEFGSYITRALEARKRLRDASVDLEME